MSRPNVIARQPNGGYSLLELMVVLVFMMTMLGTISPALGEQWQRQAQVQAMRELYAHLRSARVTAVSNNITVTACPSQSGQRCDAVNTWHLGWIVFFDPNHTGQPQHANDIIQRVDQNTYVAITSGGRQRIRFQAQGTAYGSNGTIAMCSLHNPSHAIKIVVSNPGRIRWAEDDRPSACN